MSSPQKKAQNRGKSFERWVATQLGEKRVLQKGTKVPDVVHKGWNIDCKHRKNFVAFSGYHECRKKYGDHTVVIMCQPGKPDENSIVIMDWGEWKELVEVKDDV